MSTSALLAAGVRHEIALPSSGSPKRTTAEICGKVPSRAVERCTICAPWLGGGGGGLVGLFLFLFVCWGGLREVLGGVWFESDGWMDGFVKVM